jgi:hypothetical protein
LPAAPPLRIIDGSHFEGPDGMPETSDQPDQLARPSRTRRRILIATLVVVAILAGAWLSGRPHQDKAFFAFLEQHPIAHHIARPVFVLVGKEAEFDRQIQFATIRRALDEWDLEAFNVHRIPPRPDVP